MSNHIKFILRHWKRFIPHAIFMVLLTLISSAVATAYPYIYKEIIDKINNVLENKDVYSTLELQMHEIYKFVWVLVGLGLVRFVQPFYMAFRGIMNTKFEHILRMTYFKAISEKDGSFFRKFRTGDVATRLTNDLNGRISWFMCSAIFRAFNSLINIVFILIMMFIINWKLTLYSIIPLPIMVIVFYFVQSSLSQRYRNNEMAISSINNQLEMSFSGIKIIKAFVCEEKYQRFFNDALHKRFDTEFTLIKLQAGLNLIYEYIGYIGQIFVLFFGGYMAVKGEITVGTFVAFYTYLMMIIYPILDIPQLFVSAKQSFVNIDRLEEMRMFKNSNDRFTNECKIDKIEKASFDNVNYKHTAKEVLFENLNLSLDTTKKTLLMGPVGSGKSTLISLLTGMLPVNKGKVKVNDIDIEKINREKLLGKIGYVPQDALLFSGTVYSNVNFGVDRVDEDLYEKVLEVSQLSEEIAKFPQKDKQVLGEKGTAVSGGQKQRIAIARALMRKPEYLILDDITSSLDAENEKKLWQSMNEVFPNIGALMVSHRISTVAYADEIVFINKHHECYQGTHDELMNSNVDYKKFIETQTNLKEENNA